MNLRIRAALVVLLCTLLCGCGFQLRDSADLPPQMAMTHLIIEDEYSTLGRRGNNPFCYHRATTLAARGRRERLVQVERAEGLPYDFGRFEVLEEALPES